MLLVHELLLQSPNRRKLNERIMSIAADFFAATNLSCRQAASRAMHDFIVKLMQPGASHPREELRRVVDIGRFVDTISDRSMAEAVQQRADQRFAEAIERLHEVHFVNLIVDPGTVHSLKSIVCLVTNPHAIEPPILLSLRESPHFTAHDYCNLFSELMAILDSFGVILCSIAVDNLPAHVGEVDRALQLNNSLAIHVKSSAHMANGVWPLLFRQQISRGLWIILLTSKRFSDLHKPRHSSARNV
jgi:hypothetical protein